MSVLANMDAAARSQLAALLPPPTVSPFIWAGYTDQATEGLFLDVYNNTLLPRDAMFLKLSSLKFYQIFGTCIGLRVHIFCKDG